MKDKHLSGDSLNSSGDSSPVDLPPGIDAPSPDRERQRIAAGESVAASAIEQDIRRLAHRVGGMSRLRALVTELERADR
jgi:hypothetical protein